MGWDGQRSKRNQPGGIRAEQLAASWFHTANGQPRGYSSVFPSQPEILGRAWRSMLRESAGPVLPLEHGFGDTPQDQNWASIIGQPASHRDPGIALAESACLQRSPLLARDLGCSAGHRGDGPPFFDRMGGLTCLVEVCWARFLLGGTSFGSSGFILLGLLLDPSFCSHLFRLR